MKLSILALLAYVGILPAGNDFGGQVTNSDPTITIDPTPPTQGDTITITYDGPLPVLLQLDWDPGGKKTVEITSDAGIDVEVPDNATSLHVVDTTGKAAAASTVINPK